MSKGRKGGKPRGGGRGAGGGKRSRRDDSTLGVVIGVGPVAELLRAAPHMISSLAVSGARADAAPVSKIVATARSKNIRVELVHAGDLDRAAEGGRHQGVVASTAPYPYAELEDVVRGEGAPSLVVALDSVTDPRNLGAVARSAYLLGASGIVVARDRAASVNAACAKTSAGAVFHLPIAQVTNLTRALGELKEMGLWNCAVAGTPDAQPLQKLDGNTALCLVLGSEGKGIRPQVAKECDLAAAIPMAGAGVGSFNVSVAASIALYEVHRQRSAS